MQELGEDVGGFSDANVPEIARVMRNRCAVVLESISVLQIRKDRGELTGAQVRRKVAPLKRNLQDTRAELVKLTQTLGY